MGYICLAIWRVRFLPVFAIVIVTHITFWFNAYLITKVFPFSTIFKKMISGLAAFFKIIFPPNRQGAYNPEKSFWWGCQICGRNVLLFLFALSTWMAIHPGVHIICVYKTNLLWFSSQLSIKAYAFSFNQQLIISRFWVLAWDYNLELNNPRFIKAWFWEITSMGNCLKGTEWAHFSW